MSKRHARICLIRNCPPRLQPVPTEVTASNRGDGSGGAARGRPRPALKHHFQPGAWRPCSEPPRSSGCLRPISPAPVYSAVGALTLRATRPLALRLLLIVLIAPLLRAPGALARSSPPSTPIDPGLVASTVQALGTVIRREYLDPGVAEKVDSTLRQSLAEGRYASATTAETLATALSRDLYALTRDKHLTVAVVPQQPITPERALDRDPERVDHYATEAVAPAGRNGGRPVFVLTAAQTFSAGEGVAFLIQERHRGEVVGETTAGAANPGRSYPVNERFSVTVPNGRVRSAIGGGSWEGAGVTPDVSVPAADALAAAHARALRMLIDRQPPGPWRDALERALPTVEARDSNR